MIRAADCFKNYQDFKDIINKQGWDWVREWGPLTDEAAVNEVFYQYADPEGMYYPNFAELIYALDNDYRAEEYEFNPATKKLNYRIDGNGDDYSWLIDLFAIFCHNNTGRYKIDISNIKYNTGVKGSIRVYSNGYYEDNLNYY